MPECVGREGSYSAAGQLQVADLQALRMRITNTVVKVGILLSKRDGD